MLNRSPLMAILLLILLLLPGAPRAATQSAAFDPRQAGYEKVFGDEFDDDRSIDKDATGRDGFKWYVTKFLLGYEKTEKAAFAVADGVLTIHPQDKSNWTLATAGPSRIRGAFVGTTFSHGFYVEARIALDTAKVDTAQGWPAFWALPIEKLLQTDADQCPGQPIGYKRYVEDDFFEYNVARDRGAKAFTSTVLDFFGSWKKTCRDDGYCHVGNQGPPSDFENHIVAPDEDVDWNDFHIVSQLWTPGSAENGWKGSIQNYLDGRPTTSRVEWSDSDGYGCPPRGRSIFNAMDNQGMVLILGAGLNQTMRFDWIRVWRKPARS